MAALLALGRGEQQRLGSPCRDDLPQEKHLPKHAEQRQNYSCSALNKCTDLSSTFGLEAVIYEHRCFLKKNLKLFIGIDCQKIFIPFPGRDNISHVAISVWMRMHRAGRPGRSYSRILGSHLVGRDLFSLVSASPAENAENAQTTLLQTRTGTTRTLYRDE